MTRCSVAPSQRCTARARRHTDSTTTTTSRRSPSPTARRRAGRSSTGRAGSSRSHAAARMRSPRPRRRRPSRSTRRPPPRTVRPAGAARAAPRRPVGRQRDRRRRRRPRAHRPGRVRRPPRGRPGHDAAVRRVLGSRLRCVRRGLPARRAGTATGWGCGSCGPCSYTSPSRRELRGLRLRPDARSLVDLRGRSLSHGASAGRRPGGPGAPARRSAPPASVGAAPSIRQSSSTSSSPSTASIRVVARPLSSTPFTSR